MLGITLQDKERIAREGVKIRFYMKKAPTLMLEENKPTAAAATEHRGAQEIFQKALPSQ
jgi:hypothetical protein